LSPRVRARAGRAGQPIVVKLGGSLAESGRLSSILDIVSRAQASTVIVPGGGVFADAVRAAQAELGFSVAAAHAMALLAMHQTGLMLAALDVRLRPAESLAAIRRELARGRIPVWLPYKLTLGDRLVPADWTATSDALAARLAERLGRASVVLVKSCRVPADAPITALSRSGIVDGAFGGIVKRGALDWRVLGAGDEAELALLLDVRLAGRLDRRTTPRSRRSSGVAHRRDASEHAIARRR
jgi:hypothetical protein